MKYIEYGQMVLAVMKNPWEKFKLRLTRDGLTSHDIVGILKHIPSDRVDQSLI